MPRHYRGRATIYCMGDTFYYRTG
uniref:Uncharacterized protein n=1 Tax=Arundo donax TaxID=35708 RepID=A0A0A9EK50_ARUDO